MREQQDPHDSVPGPRAGAGRILEEAIRGVERVSLPLRLVSLLELGTDVEAENRIAKAYWELGELAQAREHYQSALALDPIVSLFERRAKLSRGWAIGAVYLLQRIPGYQPRWVFLIGVLPAFVTLWIRKEVPETAEWSAEKGRQATPASCRSASESCLGPQPCSS